MEEKKSKLKWFIIGAIVIIFISFLEEKPTQTEQKPKIDKEVVVAVEEMKQREEISKPKKEELKNHILNLNIDGMNKDTLSISTFEDGFDIAFDVHTIEENIEEQGKNVLKKVLTSNPPHNIISCDIVISNNNKTIMVGYNGESYYIVEKGISRDIEIQ